MIDVMKKVVVILFCIMFLTACSVFENLSIEEQHYSNPAVDNRSDENTRSYDIPNVKQISSERDVAKDFVELAETVKGVDGATVIVSGIYSVVGLTFEKDLANTEKSKVKDLVYEALATHPRGVNTVIATDSDHIATIQDLGERLKGEKVADDVYQELGYLIGQLEPNENNNGDTYPDSKEKLEMIQ
jgi:YhcN/YlaJ family sporulation lipoprotein